MLLLKTLRLSEHGSIAFSWLDNLAHRFAPSALSGLAIARASFKGTLKAASPE
ncbi:MAG: hypothetical protein V7K98_01485 [Nostoc sp.]|uniref:hypothetical protein n=1 Tax=Nostoc sp. TaxID=1180 RepID=UPI002FF8C309